jgi:hypothetical protein
MCSIGFSGSLSVQSVGAQDIAAAGVQLPLQLFFVLLDTDGEPYVFSCPCLHNGNIEQRGSTTILFQQASDSAGWASLHPIFKEHGL